MLAFTADEAWEFVPGRAGGSIHESTWQPVRFELGAEEAKDWSALLKARETILPELEKARQSKLIGKALEAKVQLVAPAAQSFEVEKRQAADLREFLNVSQVEFLVEARADAAPAWIPVVKKAEGRKCERCWHWETDVGSSSDHPTICARCVAAVTLNART